MSELEYRLENGRIKWGDWTAADVRYVSDRGKDLVHRANSFDDLLEACKGMCSTLLNYTVALARRQDGVSSDDSEISSAIQDCVLALKRGQNTISKAEEGQ